MHRPVFSIVGCMLGAASMVAENSMPMNSKWGAHLAIVEWKRSVGCSIDYL